MTPEADDLTLCDEILRRKSKSFRLASLLLAPDVRRATVVLYAYCRRCDDAVDEVKQDPEHTRAAVRELRAEL
jgi:phytoene synthase